MKTNRKFIASLAAVAAGAIAGSAIAATIVDPNAVRTYCQTDPLKRQITANPPGVASNVTLVTTAAVPLAATRVYTDDNNTGVTGDGYPATRRGTEVVWQVIGALGDTTQPGEGYCGSLGIPPINIGTRGNVADVIQDCVAVARFDIASSNFKSAALHWEGTNGGVRLNLAITICEYSDPAFAIDREGTPGTAHNPDCIVDNDDFAGGSFTGIADVELRKADNTVGVVGGASDLDFLNLNPIRHMVLSKDAVQKINAAGEVGGSITLMVRCADSAGNSNGFLGGNDNALTIHDPGALGGLGFGDIWLELE